MPLEEFFTSQLRNFTINTKKSEKSDNEQQIIHNKLTCVSVTSTQSFFFLYRSGQKFLNSLKKSQKSSRWKSSWIHLFHLSPLIKSIYLLLSLCILTDTKSAGESFWFLSQGAAKEARGIFALVMPPQAPNMLHFRLQLHQRSP